ncbi:MAG TPA: uroporphyrinogen-III synthase [Elusimicrobiota bacterium]|nr:uroporphyrinogen-III synthase [Elusimicrobiota bacterium]
MDKPLSGRVVVVTRPRASSAPLAAALRARVARVVFAPLIRTLPPRSWRALDAALAGLAGFDAAAFASVTAVDSFFARAKTLKLRPRPPRVVAAVGRATGEALAARGWRPSVTPEDSRAEGLARALKLPRGARVLLPRAERGLELLPERLAAAGAVVARASAYRTVEDAAGKRALKRALASGADAAFFASGSAAAAAAGLRRAFRACAVVAIGPTTAAELTALGLRPAAIARTPEVGSLVAAIEAALRRRP